MSEPYICATCGLPVTPGAGFHIAGELVHADSLGCVAALKADRDRYRAVLVALRDADRARNAATDAVDGTLDGPRTNWRRYEETVDVERRAIDARRAAISAAIAAVEEGE